MQVSLSQDNNTTEQARDHSQKNWEVMLTGLKRLLEGESITGLFAAYDKAFFALDIEKSCGVLRRYVHLCWSPRCHFTEQIRISQAGIAGG